MTVPPTPATRLWSRLSNKAHRISKSLYQQARLASSRRQVVVFIIGCQRSGTDMLYHVFDEDWNAKVYGEFSELSSRDLRHKIRLNPLPEVKAALARNRVPLVVLKPLVESQNAVVLLDYFEGSRALWVYRHYKDVASSNLKKFGLRNGINNLRPIVDNEPDNWRSEKVPDDVREIVLEHYREDMNPCDAAALFWFVRNRLLFDLDLAADPRVMILKYDDLVSRPLECIEKVYGFVGCACPGAHVVAGVHARSVGKGRAVQLSPDVEDLCNGLLRALDGVCQTKAASALSAMK